MARVTDSNGFAARASACAAMRRTLRAPGALHLGHHAAEGRDLTVPEGGVGDDQRLVVREQAQALEQGELAAGRDA